MFPEPLAERQSNGGRRAGGRLEVLSMAWPLAVGMLSFTLMGVADTVLMGRVSTAAQAGVGLGTVMLFVLISFFRGLITGAQSVVAAADGAGDRDRVARAGGAGLVLGLATGGVATLALEACRRWLLPEMLEDPAVVVQADAFLRVAAFYPLLALTAHGLLAGVQGLGDTRARMWASWWGNLTNVALDLVLIFGLGPFPRLEAQGAALATLIGTGVMIGIYAWRYRRLLGRPRLPGRAVLRDALSLGLPAGTQQLFMSSAFLLTTLFLAQSGKVHLAANQVLIQVLSVSFLPGFGIGEGTGILVGRYLGAGQRDVAMAAIRSGRFLALSVMGVCGVFFAVAGGWLGSLFSPDPAVQQLVASLLRIAAIFQLFDAVAMVHLCVLRAAGDTRFSLVVTTACAWGITVPAAWLLGAYAGFGAPGAWVGVTVEIIALAALTTWRMSGMASGRVGRMDLLLGRKAVPA
ncbi:MAG: MATE family efflux transporter [Myxococcales bacterium]|nr:MATE family efflux transporter [Myxococcales bacterium]